MEHIYISVIQSRLILGTVCIIMKMNILIHFIIIHFFFFECPFIYDGALRQKAIVYLTIFLSTIQSFIWISFGKLFREIKIWKTHTSNTIIAKNNFLCLLELQTIPLLPFTILINIWYSWCWRILSEDILWLSDNGCVPRFIDLFLFACHHWFGAGMIVLLDFGLSRWCLLTIDFTMRGSKTFPYSLSGDNFIPKTLCFNRAWLWAMFLLFNTSSSTFSMCFVTGMGRSLSASFIK